MHRRLPKRGFNKWRRKDYNEINLGFLQQAIDDKRVDASKPLDVATLEQDCPGLSAAFGEDQASGDQSIRGPAGTMPSGLRSSEGEK